MFPFPARYPNCFLPRIWAAGVQNQIGCLFNSFILRLRRKDLIWLESTSSVNFPIFFLLRKRKRRRNDFGDKKAMQVSGTAPEWKLQIAASPNGWSVAASSSSISARDFTLIFLLNRLISTEEFAFVHFFFLFHFQWQNKTLADLDERSRLLGFICGGLRLFRLKLFQILDPFS